MVTEDRRYTRTHEWLRIEGTEALVGITEHAAEQLGDMLPGMGHAGSEVGMLQEQ